MSLRRLLSWIAAVALLTPMAAAAMPACGPGGHCPMAGARAAGCHGAAIQADDCCTVASAIEALEVVPLGPVVVPVAVAAEPESGLGPTAEPQPSLQRAGSATPLYTLFRALLI